MVSEATDKETGAKWAIKKVNKEKVRLSVRSLDTAPKWGRGGQCSFPSNPSCVFPWGPGVGQLLEKHGDCSSLL